MEGNRDSSISRPRLSLWQSSIDQVLHQSAVARLAAAWQPRLDLQDASLEGDIVREVARYAAVHFEEIPMSSLLESGTRVEQLLHLKPAASVKDRLSYCSSAYLKLAEALLKGDTAAEGQYRAELQRFGNCDPRYEAALQNYLEYFKLRRQEIPYKPWKSKGDFVDTLSAQCKLALVGDWGTGEEAAMTVLRQIAAKEPDIVIHLGDIYYSGTKYEAQNYFLTLFCDVFRKSSFGKDQKPRLYTMSGNHDMYSGGQGYYWLLTQVAQDASFFCLRNDNWQFVGMDTGVNDYDPFTVNSCSPTLRDSEFEWLKDKITNNGKANSVLLSHHPLFSAYERIDGKPINERLHQQVRQLLPKVTAWYWAHEHNLVVYKEFLNIHARCVGHGAFPVAVNELGPPHSDVPFFSQIHLGEENGSFKHGYVLIDLNGSQGAATYYQCDSAGVEDVVYREDLDKLP